MEDLASLLADNLMGTGFVAVIPAQSALTRDHIEEIFSVVASRMAHVFTIEASSFVISVQKIPSTTRFLLC